MARCHAASVLVVQSQRGDRSHSSSATTINRGPVTSPAISRLCSATSTALGLLVLTKRAKNEQTCFVLLMVLGLIPDHEKMIMYLYPRCISTTRSSEVIEFFLSIAVTLIALRERAFKAPGPHDF